MSAINFIIYRVNTYYIEKKDKYRKEHNKIYIRAKSIKNKRVHETKISIREHKEPSTHQGKHLQMDHIQIFRTGNKTNHRSV
jgi:hypothetical protein